MNFAEKIYYAIKPCFENAQDLFDDGEILFKKGRLPRAYTLYHFSFEETGRCFILLNIFFDYAKGKIDFRDLKPELLKKRGYQDHVKKLKKSTLEFRNFGAYFCGLDDRKDMLTRLEKLYEEFDEIAMDENKNKSIYLCLNKNEFKAPSNLLKEDDFYQMKDLAEINLHFVRLVVESLEKDGSLKEVLKKFKKEITSDGTYLTIES